MLTLEQKHGITPRSKVLRRSAAAAVLLSTLVVGCGGAGSPTTPTPTTPTPTSSTPPAPTPAPPTPAPPTSSGLVVPGVYNMNTIQTCVNGGQCATFGVPAGIFILSPGVTQQQVRGHIRFEADGTFYSESIQRTDSPLGEGPEQTFFGGGTFNVAGALISFKATPGTVAPGTVTISTDGNLLRSYDIPLEPPFVPKAVTVNVTETYRLKR